MQIESGANKDPKCLLSAAGFWMSTMEFVFGPVPIDNTRSAKIGLQASLREIAAMEEELRGELEALIGRLKVTQKQTKMDGDPLRIGDALVFGCELIIIFGGILLFGIAAYHFGRK